MDISAGIVVELRRQLAEHATRIAALERRPVPVARVTPAPVVEPMTVVTYPQPAINVALPNAAELKILCSIVLRRFPQLGPGDDLERQWKFEMDVEEAFRGLGAFGRADALDMKRYVTSWYDDLVEHLRTAQRGGTSYHAFLVAVLAWGDIPNNFDPAQQRNGISFAFGLCQPGTGRPANADGWRRVIATGDILAPTPPAVTRVAPSERAPMVKITGGNAAVGASRVVG